MGHRKHSTPRRGSLAFAPRARHQVLVPRIRNWTERGIDRPTLAAYPAFKVGMVQVVTVDDREKTPNFGKPMFNPVHLSVGCPRPHVGAAQEMVSKEG
ncbi:MAG: 50S ribosomal protein L3, partial [Nitrososphaerota archaeon]|nr:50S ribosomal protein L3 [Nitrososphaerota archaeon]